MKRSFIVAVLTVTMIIMMSAAGYALTAPHNLSCNDCHGKFVGAGLATPVSATSSCVGCHSSMGEASRMPVNPGDMANYFGSASGQPSTGSRSTHTWLAQIVTGPVEGGTVKTNPPVHPAAFVQEPINLGLNTGYQGSMDFQNTVYCVRCHNAKGTNIGVLKPFLRVTNANDAICRDCHRLRETTTHLTGSHPINYRVYSTVYKSNTTAYRKVPLSANVNNPTANPGKYLSSGKVVCSTCHAPHYADSSSATLGNRSTANGFAVDDPAKGLKGALQNSKGLLLRTDPIGLTPNAINLCSSCHKETKNLNHNGKGQNVQCDHCHGAHVDFTGDNSAPNINLVRRDFSNMSAGKKLGANVKVLFRANTTAFLRADGKGICQICHTPTSATSGVAMHDQPNTRRSDCLGCHKHSDGFSKSGCDSCHGQPPVQGKAAAGYTTDKYPDEAFTPHATHADVAYYEYGCKNCHYDGTKAGSHNTTPATFQSVFVDTAGSVGALAGFANVPANYNATTRNCSVVYCHSNGNPRVGAGNAISWKSGSTPSWPNGKNKILGQASECITCHDSTVQSGSTISTNAHLGHVFTAKIKCYVCHDATVTSDDIPSVKDRKKHANGTKDVVFVNQPLNFKGGAFSASFDPAPGAATCVNSCHTNGAGVHPVTPAKWTDQSTGACGTCHDAPPSSTLHPLHFTGTIGPKLGNSPVCASCHDTSAGTHANGVIDLKQGNSCDPCHPKDAGTPVWATTAIVTCESCHIAVAPNFKPSVVASEFRTYSAPLKSLNGHRNYSTAILKHVKCTSCHDATVNHIGAGAAEKRLIVAGNGNCNTCHIPSIMQGMSTAKANMLTHGGMVNKFTNYTTVLGNGTTAVTTRSQDCAGCHDTHGTSNLYSVRTVINGRPISFKSLTSFYVPTKTNNFYNGLCQACHTKTKYYRNYTSPAVHNPNKNCLTCHQHKGHKFAFQGSGTCNGCHGYPPVKASEIALYGTHNNYSTAKQEDYDGGGGAHTVAGHVRNYVVESQGMVNCSDCHYNTFENDTHAKSPGALNKSYVNVVVDPKWKFNSASTITYKPTNNTCSNVRCHFQASPNWTTGL
jgi:predicted CxxxxCH...CXXCH cytochrome family protein